MTNIWRCSKCGEKFTDPKTFICPYDNTQLAKEVDIELVDGDSMQDVY